ncbi:MAG: 5'/3'-nucleotidase SurE [Cuspidothrix sp.]
MTIILTNDDGIDSPGIAALCKAVSNKSVIIVAPQTHQSGCGHQVTTNQAINLQRRSDFEYAIAGTPADCVRVALSHIAEDVKYVISGINAGGNLGVDTYISGTVAAVREAAIHGIPGIAVSQYRHAKRDYDWEASVKWTSTLLENLLEISLEPGYFWNVNLPHLSPQQADPEVVFCQPCTKPLPINYRVEGDDFYYIGEYGKRERTPNSDVDICFSGKIAVTKLKV